ncbi:MAG: NAD(P)-dependent oxidoreductase [Cytophagales bacterium]|nr:NAD(P)-dependent oxidoreductase [Cytophagales bacterium]
MKETILITGSNGLLGQKLVALMVNDGKYDVIATAKGENRLPADITGYTYATLDIGNVQNVNDTLAKYKPHTVIHTAAMTNVDACELNKEDAWINNALATKYIATSCTSLGAMLIHVSTDFIFDGKDGPYDENAIAAPISFYGYTKLAAEEYVQNTPNLKWAIARTVLVYGIAYDMSRTNIILWVKKSLEDKKNIKVVNDQWRTPTLAEDLAMGCYLIAQKKAEGVYNISGKDMLTPYEIALKVADYYGLDKSYITIADSSTFSQPAKRPPKTGFIIDKARNILGYEPVSFEKGLDILSSQLIKK